MVTASLTYTGSSAATSSGAYYTDRRRNGGAVTVPAQDGALPPHPLTSGSVPATDRQLGIQTSDTDKREFVPYGPGGRSEDKKQADGAHPKDKTQVSTPKSDNRDNPQIQQEISRLQAIDTKVKAHEAAHKAAGGTMTGPASFTYTRGPDGKSYAVAGEVPISVSPGRTPRETVEKMEQVIRAALAPSDPSAQDRAVAAQASAIEQQARREESSSTVAGSGSPATGSGGPT